MQIGVDLIFKDKSLKSACENNRHVSVLLDLFRKSYLTRWNIMKMIMNINNIAEGKSWLTQYKYSKVQIK